MSQSAGSIQPHRPLRIGVLVDGFIQPRWVASILEGIQSSSFADVMVVIRNAAVPSRDSLGKRIGRKWRSLLYSWYTSWDDSRNGTPDDPLALCDVEHLVASAEILEALPQMTLHTDRFDETTIARIRQLDLDVILRFGFRLLRGDILTSARYGVWSYHHGDNRRYRGGPPCFWEVLEGNPVTGSILQVITEELDGGHVLYRSFGQTDLLSVRKTRHACYGTAQHFVLRKLRDVAERGHDGLAIHPHLETPWEPYSRRLYVTPTNREMLRFFRVIFLRTLAAKWHALVSRDEWSLAYHFAPRSGTGTSSPRPAGPSQVLHRFKSLVPPRGRWWADPFPICVNGEYYVLFEDWPANGGKGHIAVMKWTDAEGWGKASVALERPYHLSYPFLICWNGETYLIPETSANRTVEVYRAASFPTDWVLERVVLTDVRAVDPTVVEIDGQWWLFANVIPPGGGLSTDLHVYYGDSPLGPWLPHPLNPVKSDVRSARPAGRPFEVGGTWYRPAQDCSIRYGHAVVLNRVDRLTRTEYRETPVGRIDPGWRRGLLGVHTLNSHGALTVVDTERRYSRLRRHRGRLRAVG